VICVISFLYTTVCISERKAGFPGRISGGITTGVMSRSIQSLNATDEIKSAIAMRISVAVMTVFERTTFRLFGHRHNSTVLARPTSCSTKIEMGMGSHPFLQKIIAANS